MSIVSSVWSAETSETQKALFHAMLSPFPSPIERLYLWKCLLDPHAHNVLNPQMLPHLKTFLCCSNGSPAFFVEMLQTFGSKLEALIFWDTIVVPLPAHVSFSNLRKLKISFRSTTTLYHILKTATKLRQIQLRFVGTIGRVFPTQVFMQQLFVTQPFIKYIEFASIPYHVFNVFCNGIGEALQHKKQKMSKNTNIKLKLSIDSVTAIDVAKYEKIL
eukprot:722661_1